MHMYIVCVRVTCTHIAAYARVLWVDENGIQKVANSRDEDLLAEEVAGLECAHLLSGHGRHGHADVNEVHGRAERALRDDVFARAVRDHRHPLNACVSLLLREGLAENRVIGGRAHGLAACARHHA